MSAHHKAAVAAFGGPSSDHDHVRWGDLVATDNLDAEEFSAPFQVFDVDTNDPAQLIKRDQSFVSHSQGTMMNAFHFEHHESPALILEVFDFSRATPASGLVACGINYTMPRTGRLRVNAVMQNFYSEVLYSIRDHFGFSHASLEIEINLFVAFASGGSIIYSPTTILWTSRNSNGGNVSGSLSGFDSTAPYTVSADSEATLQAGQGIQIFAGSEVHIESEVDDMTTKVDAVVRFQLMKLAVSVI